MNDWQRQSASVSHDLLLYLSDYTIGCCIIIVYIPYDPPHNSNGLREMRAKVTSSCCGRYWSSLLPARLQRAIATLDDIIAEKCDDDGCNKEKIVAAAGARLAIRGAIFL